MSRTVRGLTGVAVLVTAVACRDYAHTNVYDPLVPVTITITGRDSLFSLGEQAIYTGHSPQFPDSAIGIGGFVGLDEVTPLGSTGTALVVVERPPLYPALAKGWIFVSIGCYTTFVTVEEQSGAKPFVARTKAIGVCAHEDSIPIVVTQRLVRIQLRCPDVHGCDTISVGGTASVWVDGTDALNAPVYGLQSPGVNSNFGPPIATYTIRDTTVASVVPVGVRAATVTANKSGTTWIVGVRGALVDSLKLVVR